MTACNFATAALLLQHLPASSTDPEVVGGESGLIIIFKLRPDTL